MEKIETSHATLRESHVGQITQRQQKRWKLTYFKLRNWLVYL